MLRHKLWSTLSFSLPVFTISLRVLIVECHDTQMSRKCHVTLTLQQSMSMLGPPHPPQPSSDTNHFLMMISDHWVATLHLQIKPNILWTRPLYPLKTWAAIEIKWIQLSVLNKSINHASCIHLFSAKIGRGYWEHFVGPVIHVVQDAFVIWFLTAILIAATPASYLQLRHKRRK